MITSFEIVPLASIMPAKGIDPRTQRSSEAFNTLKASIRSEGVLSPPILRRVDSGFEVIAGNRRLAAIRELVADGVDIPGAPISGVELGPAISAAIVNAEGDGHARLIALAENTARENLHPVDEYEMVAKLIDEDDQTVDSIASKFCWPARKVRARLALAKLHTIIRDAWRENAILEKDAGEFTRIPDPETQKAVFERLEKEGRLKSDATSALIRAAAGVDYGVLGSLRAVGVEAYRAAGGALVEDLFGDAPVVCDPALVRQMAADKVEATCRRLEAEGWAFAEPRESVKQHYFWPRIDLPKTLPYTTDEKTRRTKAAIVVDSYRGQELEDLPAADREKYDAANQETAEIFAAASARYLKRKKTGCFVWIDLNGLQIEYGRQQPAESRKDPQMATAESDAAEDAAPTIPTAVVEYLSKLRTIIICDRLIAEPKVCHQLLLATLNSRYGNSPLKLELRGLACLTPQNDAVYDGFSECFLALDYEPLEPLPAELCARIARGVDVSVKVAGALDNEEPALLIAAFDPAGWLIKAREVFDAGEYFRKLEKAAIASALVEMLGADYEARGKKGELVEAAVAAQKQTGWLPQQLRHPSDIGAQA